MQVRHIFVGIDLGDKNSVARIAVDRDKSDRFGFLNSRQGRARLFREVKRRSDQEDGAKIVMAYEASSCGFVWRLSTKLCLGDGLTSRLRIETETSR